MDPNPGLVQDNPRTMSDFKKSQSESALNVSIVKDFH